MGAIVGYKNPTVGDTSGTWTGAGDTFSSNDVRASITANNTDSLRAKGFSFAIPNNARIRGIEVSIEGNGDNATQSNRDLDVSLTKDGTTAVGTAKTFSLPQTTDGIVVGGGSTDLWGIALGIDIVETNAATFGVYIEKTSLTGTINIDHVVMRVYYDGGVRAEWDVNFNTKRITHKRLYIDYDAGVGGTAPTIGDVLRDTTSGALARVVTVEGWSVLAFGTLCLGEEHDGVTWANNDTLAVTSYVDTDTEANGGLSELDIGSSFTLLGGTGTRTGVIRHVYSDGVNGRMWFTSTSGTAITGNENIQISGVTRCGANGAEVANAWAGSVNLAAYQPTRIQLAYNTETTKFESASGSKRLRDTLGFEHNMCVGDTTSGATGMLMLDREDQLVATEGTLFMADVNGTFGDTNAIVALRELDYTGELNGGFYDLVGALINGQTSGVTATVRRVVDNGTTGTVYVSGASGNFTAGENLRRNSDNQVRGVLSSAGQRTRVGAATISGSAVTSSAAFFSSQDLFSDLMDQFDELIALEDDNPAQGEVRDQGYKLLNSWKLPYYSARWLHHGAISQLGTVGGADIDSIHTNYFHLGALGDDANTSVYVDQNDVVQEQFWPAGTFEFLLRNKNKNLEINNGLATFYAHLFGELYDFANVAALGLRNPVGLNTSDDPNNNTAAATVASTAVYHGIRWMFASHRLDFITGTGVIATGDCLYNVTRSQAVLICRIPNSVASGTDLHVAAFGLSLSTWAATDSLDLLDYTDFDTQSSQFVVGEAVENQTDTWNATVRFVQQYGGSRGRIWYSNATGTLANNDTIRLNGAGATRALSDGGGQTANTWAATLNAVVISDSTVVKNVQDGGGDQPYYGVVLAANATALQSYEMSKYLSRAEAGSTTDPGTLLYPDNTTKQGRKYQKANALLSPAVVNKASPFGSFAGGKWFLAPGWFLEGVAAADAQNFQLIDANGVTRNPPNFQSITIGGLAIGDRLAVIKRAESKASGGATMDFNSGTPATIDFNGTGNFLDDGFETFTDANGTTSIVISGTTSNDGTKEVASITSSLITLATGETLVNELASTTAVIRGDNVDKDMFTDGTGNNSGDADYVTSATLPGWLPSAGTLVVTDSVLGSEDPGYEDVYSYTSYSGATFVLSSTLLRTYGANARAWVPFIRKQAAATSENVTIIHSVDIPVKLVVRKKGINPFEQDLTVVSTGLSATAVRGVDPIVE